MTDIVDRLDARRHQETEITDLELLLLDATDEIVRLRAALQPFALRPDAVFLSAALGHISREHLHAARDALGPSHESKQP